MKTIISIPNWFKEKMSNCDGHITLSANETKEMSEFLGFQLHPLEDDERPIYVNAKEVEFFY